MMKEPDLKLLIDGMVAYQAGQVEAFESVYNLLRPALLQYLLYRTLNQSLSEDLLQETFLQLHRSRRTYLPGKPVLPWAVAIARNVFLMHLRSRRRRQRLEAENDRCLPESAVTRPFDGIAERQSLRKALAQLTPEQREILVMHHAWGLSFKEIAGVLGILKGTAKLRAHRAIKVLRKILGASRVTVETQEQIK